MQPKLHRVSVVIPIYQAETTIESLLSEIEPHFEVSVTPGGSRFQVCEVLLVHDNGPDDSDRLIQKLERDHVQVRGVWLSRNFGQHAATLAGMSSTSEEWIITLDEDGQHDPKFMGELIDVAMRERADVVYAKPTNKAPHGLVRNLGSKLAKWSLTKLFAADEALNYQSYRLILGSVGRTVAAYAGSGVYLDVALGWVANRVATAPVELREEGDRSSGYSYARLFSHYMRMILTAGTRGLRVVSGLGIVFALCGSVFAIYLLVSRLFGAPWPAGWTTLTVLLLFATGAILVSLGIIAEYVGTILGAVLGRPAYVIAARPDLSPFDTSEHD